MDVIISGIMLGVVFAISTLIAIPIVTAIFVTKTKNNSERKMKEIYGKIEDFENKVFSTEEDREKTKRLLKRDLIKIKTEILVTKSIKEAEDLISSL